jgi:nitric oxide reductase NorD protein
VAEAEDVIVDAARHATVFVRALWRRRAAAARTARRIPGLADLLPRLDLLVTAALGASLPIRPAQAPAPRTLLRAIFRRGEGPVASEPVPATDGATLWLPPRLALDDEQAVAEAYRALALHQALRARRGGARYAGLAGDAFRRDVFVVLEARAAEDALLRMLPGMSGALQRLRRYACARRPPLDDFPAAARGVEQWVRALLAGEDAEPALPATPAQCWAAAAAVAARLRAASAARAAQWRVHRDAWIGDFRPPAEQGAAAAPLDACDPGSEASAARSARLSRRPQVRKALEDEDDRRQGAWMIQTTQPHEHAEDGFGMQRPTDRDQTTAAEEFADSLSELPQARLVATPGRPQEVLLSDDPPAARARAAARRPAAAAELAYPEWDYRSASYRHPGAVVRIVPCALGPQAWGPATLRTYGGLLHDIRRRFEMLRADRVRLRRRTEGDEIDLSAYVEARADYRAGLPLNEAVYQQCRRARRDVAVYLLIDVSGSTDAWIGADKRIVDVEREALLLVCVALDGLGEPYAVGTFSGEGPAGVVVQTLKEFGERHDGEVVRRIAALEPQHYTRAGAALRHATAMLMKQPARHRLLVLLSDGKPNDVDQYDGRYGVEDMRQAVAEAKLQGVYPFCLTIDKQAAAYLPQVFGPHQYALLTRPERLPGVLLEWMRRLLAGG